MGELGAYLELEASVNWRVFANLAPSEALF